MSVKFGEIELVMSDKDTSLLTEIRDLLAMEVGLSQKVLELIESVTAPPQEEDGITQQEDSLDG